MAVINWTATSREEWLAGWLVVAVVRHSDRMTDERKPSNINVARSLECLWTTNNFVRPLLFLQLALSTWRHCLLWSQATYHSRHVYITLVVALSNVRQTYRTFSSCCMKCTHAGLSVIDSCYSRGIGVGYVSNAVRKLQRKITHSILINTPTRRSSQTTRTPLGTWILLSLTRERSELLSVTSALQSWRSS